jgi:Cu/Ag efflux pump CusA
MVKKLIEFALKNKLVVLMLAAGLFAWKHFVDAKKSIDAMPYLSENR